MILSYKFRAYPNNAQKKLINKTFGCTVYVYNYYLNKKIESYKNDKITLGFKECHADLTKLKKEKPWLKEPDKWALSNSLRDLELAYSRFFNGITGYPRYKKLKYHWKSYRTTFTNNNIQYLDNYIKLPKLGKVKIRGGRPISGRIMNATILQEPSGKYYVSLCCDGIVVEKKEFTEKSIGIDLGITTFITTSNGEKIENVKIYEKSLQKLRRLHRDMDRKVVGSKNWEKSRIRLAKEYEKIRHRRDDYFHKVSLSMISKNDLICTESLGISDMIEKNSKEHLHDISRSISSVSWGKFIRMLEYKSILYDKKVIKIDRYYPSSQICSVCNYKNEEVRNISIREWICPQCGAHHDRDINAAKNILNEGLKMI